MDTSDAVKKNIWYKIGLRSYIRHLEKIYNYSRALMKFAYRFLIAYAAFNKPAQYTGFICTGLTYFYIIFLFSKPKKYIYTLSSRPFLFNQ